MPTNALPKGSKNLTINVQETIDAALQEAADKLGMKKTALGRMILEDAIADREKIAAIVRKKADSLQHETPEKADPEPSKNN